MALKLIREAQIKSTISSDELQILETVKKVLGKDSLASLVESPYEPTQEDFDTWLDVIQGYAQDEGMSINKKADFFEIAGAVLENDPNNPPYSMHQAIMNKLWLDAKAKRHMAKIGRVAQAQEEEERIAQSVQSFAEPQEDDEHDDYADSEIRDMRASSDDPQHDQEAWWHEDMPDQEGDGGFGGVSAEDDMHYDSKGGIDPNGAFDAGDNYDMERDADRMDYERELAHENEEAVGAGDVAGGGAPKKKMNMLQTMLTMPKTSINQSLKGVEGEGSAAWKQHQLPKNPHPTGSMAHKAWERGMKKAMKDHLGLNEKPVVPVKKKKK